MLVKVDIVKVDMKKKIPKNPSCLYVCLRKWQFFNSWSLSPFTECLDSYVYSWSDYKENGVGIWNTQIDPIFTNQTLRPREQIRMQGSIIYFSTSFSVRLHNLCIAIIPWQEMVT